MKKKASKKKNGVELSGMFGKTSSQEERDRYFGILLEEINSKMEVVIESSNTTRVVLEQKLDDQKEWTNGKFNLVEAAITEHSRQIINLSTEVGENRKAIEKNCKAIEKNHNAINQLETVVVDHGKKIENLGDKVEENRKAINQLETVVVDHGKKIENLGGKVEENLKAINRVEEKVDKIGNRIEKVETKVETHDRILQNIASNTP